MPCFTSKSEAGVWQTDPPSPKRVKAGTGLGYCMFLLPLPLGGEGWGEGVLDPAVTHPLIRPGCAGEPPVAATFSPKGEKVQRPIVWRVPR